MGIFDRIRRAWRELFPEPRELAPLEKRRFAGVLHVWDTPGGWRRIEDLSLDTRTSAEIDTEFARGGKYL